MTDFFRGSIVCHPRRFTLVFEFRIVVATVHIIMIIPPMDVTRDSFLIRIFRGRSPGEADFRQIIGGSLVDWRMVGRLADGWQKVGTYPAPSAHPRTVVYISVYSDVPQGKFPTERSRERGMFRKYSPRISGIFL